jgi:hypothetical protein
MQRIWILAVTLTALLLVPPTATAHPSQQREIVKLKRQIVLLRKQAALARRQRDNARVRVSELIATIADTKLMTDAAAADATRMVTELVAARDAALVGLPDAIRAVPEAEFMRLVLSPARSSYRCSSNYSSEGYWSYTFTRPSEFC